MLMLAGFHAPNLLSYLKKPFRQEISPLKYLLIPVTSRENVRRMAERLGCHVDVVELDDEFKLIITR